MIGAYDKLEKQMTAELIQKDENMYKQLSRQKKDLLKQMSNEDIEELLKRDYPGQYKAMLKKYLK